MAGIFAALIVALVATFMLGMAWFKLETLKRERYIREFPLPRGLFRKLAERRPEVDAKYHPLVAQALRQYFLCHLKSGRLFVSMPSRVADDLWHEFILHTREYQAFCKRAFGGFLHHVPATALGRGENDDTGLRRAWHHACREENINPRAPARLPLLFALDAKLGVADGFRYVPDCKLLASAGAGNVHCGADLGSGSGSGDGGDGGGDGGDGGGCGGGGGD